MALAEVFFKFTHTNAFLQERPAEVDRLACIGRSRRRSQARNFSEINIATSNVNKNKPKVPVRSPFFAFLGSGRHRGFW